MNVLDFLSFTFLAAIAFGVVIWIGAFLTSRRCLDFFFREHASASGWKAKIGEWFIGLGADLLRRSGAVGRYCDKWTVARIERAREQFETQRFVTENEHRFLIPCPAWIGESDCGDVTRSLLRQHFETGRVPVAISGAAGAGKSSIAVQACRWALDSDEKQGLFAGKVVIPVLLPARNLQIKSLLRDIAGCLRELNPASDDEIPEWLVCLLLKHGHLLLVVDDLSDASSKFTSRLAKFWDEIGGRHLLLTSRRSVNGFRQVNNLELRDFSPDRFEGFIAQYLQLSGARAPGTIPKELATLYRRLTQEHPSSGFLLKLFCEQYLRGDRRISEISVRKLMQDYVARINRNAHHPVDPADAAVWDACGKLALEIVAANRFRPGAIPTAKAKAIVEPRVPLSYLVDVLRVVLDERGTVRFCSRTILLSMAALWDIQQLGGQDDEWSQRLSDLEASTQESHAYVSMLYECGRSNSTSIQTAVLDRLRSLTQQSGATEPTHTPDGRYSIVRSLSTGPVRAPSGATYETFELLPIDEPGKRVHGKRYDLGDVPRKLVQDLEAKAYRHFQVCQVLQSPYVQKCLGTYRDPSGTHLWVYERWIDGDTLTVRRHERSVQDDHVRIMNSVAAGIADIHKNEKVIRSLDPDSIILADWTDEPTLTNFEMTKTYTDKTVSAGAKFEKPPYVAPEVRDNSSLANTAQPEAQQADIYSWAAVYFFLLTGKQPAFPEDADLRELLRRTSASQETVELIVRCLSYARSRRPVSIAEVLSLH